MALRWAENCKCTRLQIQKSKQNIRACRACKLLCKRRMHNFRMSFLMHTLMYWFISWKKHSLPFWNSLFTRPSPSCVRTGTYVSTHACACQHQFVHCDDCEFIVSEVTLSYFFFFLYSNLNIIMLLFHERYYKITFFQLYLLYHFV